MQLKLVRIGTKEVIRTERRDTDRESSEVQEVKGRISLLEESLKEKSTTSAKLK